ncbi:MAG: flotillin family protein [Planctomycetota bacterium]|jgi:uncharacterized membrane protein YqiK|nr:flotillin family protein [Planctomycetota bacterium]
MAPFIALGIVGFIILLGIIILIIRCYRKVPQGTALIINKTGSKVIVSFTGGVVIPIIHKAEYMDISVKAMEIDRSGSNGLICEDNIRADIKVTFYVRVNKTEEDVKRVAGLIGCERASKRDTLEELFSAKFSEALKTVGKQMEFTTLFTEREKFKEAIINVIGADLNGYKLEDVAIDYLEQTPLESLDADNILDAQGIRKIVDLTSVEAMSTNSFQRNKEKTIKQQDVEAKETILELEKQQADAEARQKREIESIQAREGAETEKVRAEERLKYERAQIQTAEELAVAEENKQRQIEIARKARERAVLVEAERVERDQQLEAVERNRLVTLKDIEKEKAVEVEKKNIQEVIRERVMVEKGVAEEQEKIKDTVELAGAERQRQVEVIAAQREAEENMVIEVKAAEAKEKAAKSLYEEAVTQAEARRLSAQKEAEAKKVLAEGLIAERSAEGLAEVKVREAEANAIELQGKAEATAATERARADAFAVESKGEAEAKSATANYKAEAEGTEITGSAEAKAIDQKADAMKKYDSVGKEHEEFKLELGKQERVELAQIDVDRQIAEAQAGILGEAMKSADIDIVGGDGEFLNNFFKSITLAKSVDGFVDKSEVVQKLSNGDVNNLMEKIKDLVNREGLGSEDIKNLTVSALLARLALKGKDTSIKEEAAGLQGIVKSLGAEDLMAMWLAK